MMNEILIGIIAAMTAGLGMWAYVRQEYKAKLIHATEIAVQLAEKRQRTIVELRALAESITTEIAHIAFVPTGPITDGDAMAIQRLKNIREAASNMLSDTQMSEQPNYVQRTTHYTSGRVVVAFICAAVIVVSLLSAIDSVFFGNSYDMSNWSLTNTALMAVPTSVCLILMAIAVLILDMSKKIWE